MLKRISLTLVFVAGLASPSFADTACDRAAYMCFTEVLRMQAAKESGQIVLRGCQKLMGMTSSEDIKAAQEKACKTVINEVNDRLTLSMDEYVECGCNHGCAEICTLGE